MYRWPYANFHLWHGRVGLPNQTPPPAQQYPEITPQQNPRKTELLPFSAMIEEREWISIVNYISLSDDEGHDFEAEAIGYFWGFARATGSILLALESDAKTHEYHLLVSFGSMEQKKLYLDLAAANELTELADDIVGLPDETEIRKARSPEYVFDEEILRVARPIADRIARLLWPDDGQSPPTKVL